MLSLKQSLENDATSRLFYASKPKAQALESTSHSFSEAIILMNSHSEDVSILLLCRAKVKCIKGKGGTLKSLAKDCLLKKTIPTAG